ncbi:MAG: hypothetical protein GXY86_08215 [Firmicutes bacterium]|nr:hypothetical protein [Bacillota bacterium]
MKKGLLKTVWLGLLIVILLSTPCFAAEKYRKVDKIDGFKLEIGAILPQKFLDKNKPRELKVSSSQTAPGYNIEYKEIEYKIGVDGNNAIIFISTEDPQFVTVEKIRPGMAFTDAFKLAPKASVIMESGWIGYIPFKSGWNAAVLLDERDQWSYFDKVAFVFMRQE